MGQPRKPVSESSVDLDDDFGFGFNKEVLDACFVSAMKAYQEYLERGKQPIPPKPQTALGVLKSGRLDTLRPSRHWRPR